MNAALQSDVITIPLHSLTLSPRNVRKTSGKEVDELAASIAAHGLLQNLNAVKVDGHYEVIAGGLRLAAMQKLRKEGVLTDEFLVPVHVIPDEAALEASLTENVSRHAMHPADEFDAFHKLATGPEKATAGDIAARFGKSELYVRQRMKLANVAPEILKEYRAGKATLEQMMALALTDDQALQARVWKANRAEWQRRPDQLRKAITAREVAANSKAARFIGIEAYESAGGQVRRDLFGDDNETYLIDAKLVERLVLEKLEKTAQRVRKEGWKWVECRISFEWQDREKFGASQDKKHAGAVVHLNYNDNPEIIRGLVRPEDRKAAGKGGKTTTSSAGNRTGTKAAPMRKPGDLSFAAVQRLQAEGGAIVASEVAKSPGLALKLLAAELADDVFYTGYDSPRTWVHVARGNTNRMPGIIAGAIDEQCAARQSVHALEKDWRAKLPKKRGEARAWILAQSDEDVQKLLAFLIAREIDVVDVAPRGNSGIIELASATKVDLSRHWKPTAAWLATLPKSTVLAMAQDAGAKDIELATLRKMPKVKLHEAAAACFNAGWLPKPLRPASAKPAAKKKAPAKKAPAKKAKRKA